MSRRRHSSPVRISRAFFSRRFNVAVVIRSPFLVMSVLAFVFSLLPPFSLRLPAVERAMNCESEVLYLLTCKHVFASSPASRCFFNPLHRELLLNSWRRIRKGIYKGVLGFFSDRLRKTNSNTCWRAPRLCSRGSRLRHAEMLP